MDDGEYQSECEREQARSEQLEEAVSVYKTASRAEEHLEREIHETRT